MLMSDWVPKPSRWFKASSGAFWGTVAEPGMLSVPVALPLKYRSLGNGRMPPSGTKRAWNPALGLGSPEPLVPDTQAARGAAMNTRRAATRRFIIGFTPKILRLGYAAARGLARRDPARKSLQDGP